MVGTTANHFACNGRSYADHTHGDVLYACAWAYVTQDWYLFSASCTCIRQGLPSSTESRIRVVSYHLECGTVYLQQRDEVRKEQNRTEHRC